ncbi:MAG: hypothetical protein WD875_04140 [Pirellulales bacterium]
MVRFRHLMLAVLVFATIAQRGAAVETVSVELHILEYYVADAESGASLRELLPVPPDPRGLSGERAEAVVTQLNKSLS